MKKLIRLFSSRWEFILLLSILILGAYERLYNIGAYLTFLGDEGRDVLVVKRMIVDHKLTLLGPTASVGGFFLGPIYYYFMLPFLWAWQLDPVGPAVMVGLVGVATIYLLYVLGKTLISPLAGIVAASLYAVSPVVIAYSRSSWNPNIVPFFATLLIYLLWQLRAKPTRFTSLWIGIVLGIGLQLHYLFLFLFVVVGVWYILLSKKMSISREAGFALLGFLIGYSPFLAFEVRHGFPNTWSIFRFISTGDDTGFSSGSFFTIISDVVFRVFGRLVFRMPPSELWNNFSKPYMATLTGIVRTGIYTSIGYGLFQIVRGLASAKKRTPAFWIWMLLGLWFVVPLILFGLYHKPIYDYYFGIFFPVPFLLVAAVLTRLMRHSIGKWVAIVAWIGLLYFNWEGRPFVYAPNNQLGQMRLIAQTALEKAGGKPFNFALIADGNSDHAYRYFFEIANQAPVTIENVQNDPQRKTVTDQLIIICEKTDCQPLGHSLWEIAGFGRAEIAGVWEVPFVKIYRLVHYKGNL